MEFIEKFPTKDLVSADYNPRFIDNTAFTELKESIKLFGVIKPLIINGENNILTAGHQRLKALKELDFIEVPVIRLEGITKSDEIMFNLFHNSVETDLSKVGLCLSSQTSFGYSFIGPRLINMRVNSNPLVVKEISKLIIKYGAWGSIICDEEGRIITNSEYAIACKLLEKPLLIYKMPNEKVEKLKWYLTKDYGKYYFDKLGVKDYNQTFCQMNRLTGEKSLKSTTYTKYVLPMLNKNVRVLDFGAGKCSYPKSLRKQGFNVFMYEPFIRQDKTNLLDVDRVISFIDEIQKDIEKNGLYDIVILDSVLNSVTTLEMQNSILTTCNALLKNNGKLIIGTRSFGKVSSALVQKRATDKKRDLEFLDDEKFSVTFRNGVWTKQRFTTKEQLKEELMPYFKCVETFGSETRSNIYAICKNPIRFDEDIYKKALETEFNMEYPDGFKHNKHKKLIDTILKSVLLVDNIKIES